MQRHPLWGKGWMVVLCAAACASSPAPGDPGAFRAAPRVVGEMRERVRPPVSPMARRLPGHERLGLRGGSGGGIEDEIVEEDGMYKLGDFLFHSPIDARRLSSEPFFAKERGSLLNPFNWPKQASSVVTNKLFVQFKSLLAGKPQKTNSMKRLNNAEEKGPLVMIDGADDLASALQGSGLPQRLQFALQAFVLYPLVLPVVEIGFKGAEEDHNECREEAREARDKLSIIKQRIADTLSVPLAQHCSICEEDARRLLMTKDGRALLLASIESGVPCKVPAVPIEDQKVPSANENKGVCAAIWGLRKGVAAEEISTWKHHKDDVRFVKGCKSIIRALWSQAQVDRAPVEAGVRLLSSLDDEVTKAWEPRVRSILTSKGAMMGTAGMWWAMLGHELAALSNFLGGQKLAVKLTAFSDMWLPLAQLSMALYGLSVGVNGVQEYIVHCRSLRLLETSRVLGPCHQPRDSLVLQVKALTTSNILSQIVAGPMLFIGQIAMALGGGALGGPFSCLVVGGALTLMSIAFKAFIDIMEDRRFGFDDEALPVREELLKDLPPTAESEGFERQAVAMLQARRRMQLHQLAWIKILKYMREESLPAKFGISTCASHGIRRLFGLEDKGDKGIEERLRKRLGRTYQRGYQSELREVLGRVIRIASVWEAVQDCIPLAKDGMFMSFLTLRILRTIEEQPWHSSQIKSEGCVVDPDVCRRVDEQDGERTAELAAEIKTAIAEWQALDRKSQTELVLDLLQRENLTAHMHQIVLTSMIVQGPWDMRPVPLHKPFVEIVDFCEERRFKVPFLTLTTYKHKKKAYRFKADAYLRAMDRTTRATTLSHNFNVVRSSSTMGDPESMQSYLSKIERYVEAGAWSAVCLHRKYRARSELGCLNDSLMAMVKQRELKKEVGVSLPADLPPGQTK